MDKAKMLKVLNPVLFISILTQATSIFLKNISGIFIKDISRQMDLKGTLDIIHTYNGYIFIGLLTIHIFLNWNWIKANIFKIKKKQ
jgi:hypothetical protein